LLVANLALMFAGTAISIPDNTFAVFAGITLCTFGFFGGHSVASGWVNRRSAAGKAQSASVYLVFYYVGSGLFGTLGGWVWLHYRWLGIVALVFALLLAALAIASRVAGKGKEEGAA
jgi:YNFM family putative membrane transporter